MGEAKRRREAIARGEPDPGIKGFKHGGRRKVKADMEMRAAMRKMHAQQKAQTEAAVIADRGIAKARAEGKLP